MTIKSASSSFIKSKIFAVCVLFSIILLLGIWYLLTPHSYEDCILKNVKSGASVEVASKIQTACNLKFYPEEIETPKNCKKVQQSTETASLYPATATIDFDNFAEVTIHNNSPTLAIKSVRAAFLTTAKATPEVYELEVKGRFIEPLSTGNTWRHQGKLLHKPEKDWSFDILSFDVCEYSN